jgi:hypothetical protein
MNSIKQVIVNAVYKVSEDPQYANKDYPTPQDARADFIKSLIAELFPDNPSVPESTYVAPVVVAEKKKRAPKAKKEAEVKVEVPVVAEVKTEEVVAEAKTEEPKKKRAPKSKKEPEVVAEAKTEEVTTDMKHKEVVAEVKAEEPKEKKKRAPKAKKEEEVKGEEPKEEKKPKTKKEKEEKPKHVEKLSPTDTKKLKAIADEAKQEFDKKAVLAYLNGLEKETLDSKTLEEHARDFYAPKEVMVEKELLVVEFKGEEYCVDTDSTPMKVYKSEGEVDKLVGHVGALEFADMVVPSYE